VNKITAYLCGEWARLAGKETVCVGGGRQDRRQGFAARGPNLRGPCDWWDLMEAATPRVERCAVGASVAVGGVH